MMIVCGECGYSYDKARGICPECGCAYEDSPAAKNISGLTNCPNCGAPVTNSISCEYCETCFPKTQRDRVIVQQVNNGNNNNDGISAGAAAFLGGVVGGILGS